MKYVHNLRLETIFRKKNVISEHNFLHRNSNMIMHILLAYCSWGIHEIQSLGGVFVLLIPKGKDITID